MSTAYTTGRLLVATPQIDEGIFWRSVVLMLHHDEDGAQGVVLNKPVDAEIDAILPGWGGHATDPDTVFQGGPVGLDTALGLVSVPGTGDIPGIRRLFRSTGVVDLDSSPSDTLSVVSALRVFVGYAGWSPRQLEGEIATGSWWVVDAESGDPFAEAPELLWRAVLARQPGSLSWMARFPDDPTLN